MKDFNKIIILFRGYVNIIMIYWTYSMPSDTSSDRPPSTSMLFNSHAAVSQSIMLTLTNFDIAKNISTYKSKIQKVKI